MKRADGASVGTAVLVWGFVLIFLTVGLLLNAFHIHGWKWVALALPISWVLLVASWLLVKRIAATTKTAPGGGTRGNRALRREKSRRK